MNIYPITIFVYPLFGGWRAECKNCGAYANSEGNKDKSPIVEALENLAKQPIVFSEKSTTCNHQYGSYKPRVNCYIDARHVHSVPAPRKFEYEYKYNESSGRWEPDFDAIATSNDTIDSIRINNKYSLKVSNPVRTLPVQETKPELMLASERPNLSDETQKQLDALNAAIEKSITEAVIHIHKTVVRQEKHLTQLKYIAVSLLVFIAAIIFTGTFYTN